MRGEIALPARLDRSEIARYAGTGRCLPAELIPLADACEAELLSLSPRRCARRLPRTALPFASDALDAHLDGVGAFTTVDAPLQACKACMTREAVSGADCAACAQSKGHSSATSCAAYTRDKHNTTATGRTACMREKSNAPVTSCVNSTHGARSVSGPDASPLPNAAPAGPCEAVYLTALTLGSECDRLLRLWSVQSMAKAAIGQAVAATYMDACCAAHQAALAQTLAPDEHLLPAFSPGYGDFPLSTQAALLDLLDAARRIGLSLTTGGMLVPEKSVTAVVGITRGAPRACARGCAACSMKQCAFRKGN